MNTSRTKRAVKSGNVTKQGVKDILLSRQEVKQYTTALSGATAHSTAGSLLRLLPLAQASNIGDRTGDQVYLRELELRVTTYVATAAVSSSYRIIVFQDTMGSGGAIGVTELLETNNYSSPISALSYQRKRFHILYDKFFVAVGGTQTQEVIADIRLKVNRTVWFNDNTVNATNIGKNAPYMLVIASAPNGDFFYQWKANYTDS